MTDHVAVELRRFAHRVEYGAEPSAPPAVDVLLALASEWEVDTDGRESTTGYERGSLFAFAKCAKQLRAALAQPHGQAAAPLRTIGDDAPLSAYLDGLCLGTLTPLDQMGLDNKLHDLGVHDMPANPPAREGGEDAFTQVCDALGIGSAARTVGVALANIRNLKRFAEHLHAIEREFFMVPSEPDEDSPDDDPGEECLLNCWGSTTAEYVEQFRSALAKIGTTPPKTEGAEAAVAWQVWRGDALGWCGVDAHDAQLLEESGLLVRPLHTTPAAAQASDPIDRAIADALSPKGGAGIVRVDYVDPASTRAQASDRELAQRLVDEHEALWDVLPYDGRYLDPPDGGDVSLVEQVRRMAKDADRWHQQAGGTGRAEAWTLEQIGAAWREGVSRPGGSWLLFRQALTATPTPPSEDSAAAPMNVA